MIQASVIKDLKKQYKNIYKFVVNNNEYIVKKPNVSDCYRIEYAARTENENSINNTLLDLVVYPDTIIDADKNILVDKIWKTTYFSSKENLEKLEEKTSVDKCSRIIQSKLLCMRAFSQFKYEDFANMEIEELFTIANISKAILDARQISEDNVDMKYDTKNLVENEKDPIRKAAIINAEQQRQKLAKSIEGRRKYKKLG
jgi:hypothetical protein